MSENEKHRNILTETEITHEIIKDIYYNFFKFSSKFENLKLPFCLKILYIIFNNIF